mmetsp:Transcript_65859/g.157406  ORF Transcript_65859/g.157406 Transcript_65859/m.157406 type:complete len:245 (+) Transcript_65859:112-846(+)|eukprot:CAMPEP_0178440550 /NCGR_PEP_ID=MMETSP0689_2-20121128/36853_1 /TAXON_ID=160604 /ORGANISM="Amphidinium massartii, Strain CS-259" /LENGTH=244 /DNA_ID=CAMNT_0020063361 /DNA_START=70 /DNA_END=804 /DNA_ORIENTATION=-
MAGKQESNGEKGSERAACTSLMLPLSDQKLDLKILNKLLSNAQSREKSLKIVQYSSKLLAYILARMAYKVWSKHWNDLAKSLSSARRFFKFFRWLKHFEDLKEAKDEKDPSYRNLLYADVACNLAADISEDITSLEKLGVLRKGSLPARTEYYSNWCQLVLAVVEIMVTAVKVRRQSEATKDSPTVASQRKLALANLEFSKFIADLIKAFWDCELSFASELLFCLSGLWASLVSTHKYALKAAK